MVPLGFRSVIGGQKVVVRGDPRIQGKEALVVKATCPKKFWSRISIFLRAVFTVHFHSSICKGFYFLE